MGGGETRKGEAEEKWLGERIEKEDEQVENQDAVSTG